MPKRPSSGDTYRLGVPDEAQRAARRQSAFAGESPHYSTLDPVETIQAQGQFLRKATGRSWPGWIIAASWFFAGLPAAAFLTVAVVSAFGSAHGTVIERVWRVLPACLFSGIPLLVVINMTRNWLLRKKERRHATRRA